MNRGRELSQRPTPLDCVQNNSEAALRGGFLIAMTNIAPPSTFRTTTIRLGIS
jgi:hypothetical protein